MELRQFIEILDNRGALKRVGKCVNWKYEIGEIARQEKNSPLLFSNIKDYPEHSLFTGGFSRISCMAISLGISPELTRVQFIVELRKRLKNPVEPVIGSWGESVEVYQKHKVNLFALPVPWWNRSDAGRYIGTWHINVSKDPISCKRNVGVYRMQIIDSNHTTVSVSPAGHLAMHVRGAEEAKKDLELAVAIGVDEAVMMAAGAAVPFGDDEYAVAGSLGGKAVELVSCRDVDLQVPSGAEYVLEGTIKSGVRVQDGPYFDYAGIPSINPSAYLFEVKTITQKKSPVFRGMSVGEPGAEDHQLFSVLSALGLTDFHGSRVRHKIQNILLKSEHFRLFQFTGRKGSIVKR